MNVWNLIRVAVGFMGRRRRPFALAAVLVVLVGPLPLTGNIEVFAVNAAGLAWVGLLLLRLMGTGNKNRTTTKGRKR